MAQWTSPGTNYMVRNNMWNCQSTPDPCGPETVWANSYQNWGVQTTQAAGNTAVLSYPDVQGLLTQSNGNDTPLSNLTLDRSSFSITMPTGSGLDDEAAYDDWLNNWNTEVMIWVYNQGQTPAGSVRAHPLIWGQNWTFWATGSKGDPNNTYTFVLNKNETNGTVHELGMFQWLEQNGWIPASSGVTDNEFGFEMCSTGGHSADYTVNNYTMSVASK